MSDQASLAMCNAQLFASLLAAPSAAPEQAEPVAKTRKAKAAPEIALQANGLTITTDGDVTADPAATE